MGLTVRETLARRTYNGARRTFPIVYAEGNAVVVAEIVLGQIPMQMLLGTVLVDAAHSALENPCGVKPIMMAARVRLPVNFLFFTGNSV